MHTLLLLIQLKFKLETILIVYKKKHYRLAVFRSKKWVELPNFLSVLLKNSISFLFRKRTPKYYYLENIFLSLISLLVFIEFGDFYHKLIFSYCVSIDPIASNCIIYGPRFCKYEFTNLKLYYYYYFIPIYVYCTVCTVHNHFVLRWYRDVVLQKMQKIKVMNANEPTKLLRT